jgi:TonB family protein
MANQDVIDMVSLGLSDDVIIEKIHAVDSTDFDTSIKGLRALKAGKVSDLVIRAMINPHPVKGAGHNFALGEPDGNQEAAFTARQSPVQHSQAQAEGSLVRRVSPTYPPLARTARVEGDVVLDVIIGANGVVEEAKTVTGHPLLIPAAIDAVSQWVFKPYLVEGKPAEVKTQIRLRFRLSGTESASPTAPVSSTGSESQATRGGWVECENVSAVECRERWREKEAEL